MLLRIRKNVSKLIGEIEQSFAPSVGFGRQLAFPPWELQAQRTAAHVFLSAFECGIDCDDSTPDSAATAYDVHDTGTMYGSTGTDLCDLMVCGGGSDPW